MVQDFHAKVAHAYLIGIRKAKSEPHHIGSNFFFNAAKFIARVAGPFFHFLNQACNVHRVPHFYFIQLVCFSFIRICGSVIV